LIAEGIHQLNPQHEALAGLAARWAFSSKIHAQLFDVDQSQLILGS
jgi:hypothetical protein